MTPGAPECHGQTDPAAATEPRALAEETIGPVWVGPGWSQASGQSEAGGPEEREEGEGDELIEAEAGGSCTAGFGGGRVPGPRGAALAAGKARSLQSLWSPTHTRCWPSRLIWGPVVFMTVKE